MFTINLNNIIRLILLTLFCSCVGNATVVNGRIITNNFNESIYSVKLQINTDSGIDDMGGATIVIRYDSTQLFFPDIPFDGIHFLFHNFTNGTYSPAIITKVSGDMLWLNIVLNSDNKGVIVAGNNDWTDLATIYFTKLAQIPSESVAWDIESDFWSIYDADNSTFWLKGNFGRLTTIQNEDFSPENFELLQNYPNPFNPSTTIRYNLPAESYVNISVFNILGERVDELVNKQMSAGSHTVNFNARGLASGIYIYRIEGNALSGNSKFVDVKKMMLVK